MTPDQLAAACAASMWDDDRASQKLGMTIDRIAPGEATMSMVVTDAMVNGHGTCHGGFIFAVADSTFAYACNSFNHRAVAAGVDINFLAPAHLGDTLTAHGHARHQGGRSGVYDIEVTNQAGKLIAVFRGRAARIKGHFFETEENRVSTEG